MHAAATDEELSIPQSIVSGRVAQLRLATGLLQGAILYFLYWSIKNTGWPIANMYFFAPLVIIFLFVPALFVSSLGHLEKRRIAIWMCAAVAICIGLTAYDIWRSGLVQPDRFFFGGKTAGYTPSGWLLFFLPVGFYIAHALVLAGASDNRRIAGYPSYFEAAWKLIIQIAFSLLFVGVLWLILWLGAMLFMLVKLDFLRELLQRSWFCVIVTTFSFSTALHVTDVRPGIVRGIRSLLLVLMSWLLPVTTLIVGGFLASLPFAGLEPLWATRHATSVLLGATAALVLLINAAFQSGELDKQVARVLRLVARLACILLLPMTLIAIYSLALRVQQYGWTSDRVIAAASLLVATCYACGYLWAAVERGTWLARIAPTNIATAFVALAVLVALFTPVADPARLSVASQMARLENGKVSAEKFDYHYLRFDGARYGNNALQTLKTTTAGADAATIRARAEAALLAKSRWNRDQQKPAADAHTRAAGITVQQDRKCNAYLADINDDGKVDILIRNAENRGRFVVFTLGADGTWQPGGLLNGPQSSCDESTRALEEGRYQLAMPLFRDMQIEGQRWHVEPWPSEQGKCQSAKK